MKKSLLLFSFLVLIIGQALAQYTAPGKSAKARAMRLHFPTDAGWTVLKEGQKLEFGVQASGGTDTLYHCSIQQGEVEAMTFDSLGFFSWTPSFDLVHRLSGSKTVQVIFEARNPKNESVNQVGDIK